MTKPANTKNSLPAPLAPRRPHSFTTHGITVVDDYAWLKDANWQEVLRDPSILDADIRQYLEAEGIPNFYTPENAVEAFSFLCAYRRNQRQLMEVPPALSSAENAPDLAHAAAIRDAALAEGRITGELAGEVLRRRG